MVSWYQELAVVNVLHSLEVKNFWFYKNALC